MAKLGKILWLCGNSKKLEWEFVGIFDEKEKAIMACKDKYYFVAPIKINAIAPDKRTVFPDSFFPLTLKEYNHGEACR